MDAVSTHGGQQAHGVALVRADGLKELRVEARDLHRSAVGARPVVHRPIATVGVARAGVAEVARVGVGARCAARTAVADVVRQVALARIGERARRAARAAVADVVRQVALAVVSVAIVAVILEIRVRAQVVRTAVVDLKRRVVAVVAVRRVGAKCADLRRRLAENNAVVILIRRAAGGRRVRGRAAAAVAAAEQAC